MMTRTLEGGSTDAAAARQSRRLRHDLVRRLLAAAQQSTPAPHAEVLAAAWNEAARSRISRITAAPREP